MSGAVPTSALGGMFFAKRREPRVTVRSMLDTFYVCVREPGAARTTIVAETRTRGMADTLAEALRRNECA